MKKVLKEKSETSVYASMADDDLIQKTSQQPKTTLRRGVFSLDWHYFSLNDTGVRLIGCFSWQVGMRKHVDPPLHSCCMMLQSAYLCLRLAVPASLGEAGGHLPADKTNSDERWCKGGGGSSNQRVERGCHHERTSPFPRTCTIKRSNGTSKTLPYPLNEQGFPWWSSLFLWTN